MKRFGPNFDPGFIAAYFDQTSRYAYGRQADACMWAMCRLADCFIAFCDKQALEEQLHDFYPQMETALAAGLARRLGVLPTHDLKAGQELCRQFFNAARASEAGFDQLLHDFWGGSQRRGNYPEDVIASFDPIIERLSWICLPLLVASSAFMTLSTSPMRPY